jgi:hypothetical protein
MVLHNIKILMNMILPEETRRQPSFQHSLVVISQYRNTIFFLSGVQSQLHPEKEMVLNM